MNNSIDDTHTAGGLAKGLPRPMLFVKWHAELQRLRPLRIVKLDPSSSRIQKIFVRCDILYARVFLVHPLRASIREMLVGKKISLTEFKVASYHWKVKARQTAGMNLKKQGIVARGSLRLSTRRV